jgi:hypothetical protein
MYHKTYLFSDCLLPPWRSLYWLVSREKVIGDKGIALVLK